MDMDEDVGVIKSWVDLYVLVVPGVTSSRPGKGRPNYARASPLPHSTLHRASPGVEAEEEEHKKKKEEEEAALQLEWPVTPAPPQRWHQVREEQAASVIFEEIEDLISSELLGSAAQLNHVL